MKPVIYLAGAIRDNRPDDIEWRERVISALGDKATFLNPLGGKTYNSETREWTMSHKVPSTTKHIVPQDLWEVDRADIVIANLSALAEGYPNIGTLMEFGRATARGALIYTVLEANYAGHDNPKMYSLHPFLDWLSAASFTSVDDLIAFLHRHLDVLSGANPHFDGVI